MKRLKIGKIFHSRFVGVPRETVHHLPPPDTVALVPVAVPFMKLKLLVRENDAVEIGTALLQDKRDPGVQFVSPAGGTVETIVRGARRVIKEIVIRRAQTAEPATTFSPISRHDLDAMPRAEVIDLLKKRGIWPHIRQFPYMDLPDTRAPISMAIVSLHSGDPFAPVPSLFLKDQQDAFLQGLAVLEKLAKTVVVTSPRRFLSSLETLGLREQITHVTRDEYPAGDPGVILFQTKTGTADNSSCTMAPQEVIAMGRLFLTGAYHTHRVYAVGGPSVSSAVHYHARTGCPLAHLTGEMQPGRGGITGGLFAGNLSAADTHMGSGMDSAVVLDAADADAFFGFVWPGRELLSESRTFLSVLKPAPRQMDAGLHGEERACINCGWCDKKCPVDLMPQFIMKAVGAGEMEEALSMGLLDCTGCGLCTFVCPSKIDLAALLEMATQRCYRERVMS